MPQSSIEPYIEIASMRVPVRVWGKAAKYATALLAAHMLTASGRGGLGAGGGSINSETVGDLSRSFSVVGMAGSSDQELLTTRYGIDYVAFRRENIVGMIVTGHGPYTGEPLDDGICQDTLIADIQTMLTNTLNSLLNPAFDQLDDYVSSTVAYHGDASPGTLDTQALWRIKKIEVTGQTSVITFASGTSTFDKVWTNRLSYSYS